MFYAVKNGSTRSPARRKLNFARLATTDWLWFSPLDWDCGKGSRCKPQCPRRSAGPPCFDSLGALKAKSQPPKACLSPLLGQPLHHHRENLLFCWRCHTVIYLNSAVKAETLLKGPKNDSLIGHFTFDIWQRPIWRR